jgi:hypothetical protein
METVALVLGINLVVWLVLGLWIRHRARSGAAQMATALHRQPTRLAGRARYLGRASAGRGQIRGTGDLALTADELVFVMWVPRRTLRIRRPDIEAVDTPKSFLGKTSGVRLLRVRWLEGETVDEAAWHVRDLDAWLRALAT